MNLTIREYSFFALSLLAGLWFFIAYPSQTPRAIVDLPMDATSIEKKAISQLETLGYSTPLYKIETSFHARNELLDSLQTEMGRKEIIDYFKRNDVANIEVFYWEISFSKQTSDEDDIVIEAGSGEEENINSNINTIQVRFDDDGQFIELVNKSHILPQKRINREAMAAAFPAVRDSALAVLSEFSDSALSQQIYIRAQQNGGVPDALDRLQRVEKLLEQGQRFVLSGEDVFKIGLYYLDKTGWQSSDFSADTVVVNRINGKNIASARFSLTEPKLSQELQLTVKLNPTGGLLGLLASYNAGESENSAFPELWPVIQNALIFLICLAGVILFFFRIRARAIDTKPALVVAIIAGIAVSLQLVLSSDVVLGESEEGTVVTLILIMAGLAGAVACLLYFVFFAIGDSITRQFWPQKLSTYNYLRQGLIFNQPVGSMLIRSVMLAFILAGLWTLLLTLFPNLYIDIEPVFLDRDSLWPPLYLFIVTLLSSLSVVLAVFLVLGGQIYSQTQNRTITAAAMILACIALPITGDIGPLFYELIFAGMLGVLLTVIYLKWDFLTLLVSYFLFLGLLSTSSGWVIEGSIDIYIFISFLLLMVFLIVSGVLAIARGEKEQGLTHFVPEYVEELAQEERIKQELEIARKVQQSFLPVQTPEFPHLELSAICKPAYETGGDYYDFIPLDESRVAVTIGDVSGKGIQAAFYMTFVKGIIHSLCYEINSPAELLKKANRLFYDNAPRGTFISLVYGIIDLKNQSFHFARAGHNPILKINARNDEIKELQPKGIGIGLTKETSFDDNIEEIELKLCSDDVLALYTDGIVEALNENHVFYGSHRLNNVLKKNKKKSAGVILNEVTNDVEDYIGKAKQHDDMTMIVMKLKE